MISDKENYKPAISWVENSANLKLIEGTTEPNLQVVSCAPFQPTLWLQFSTVALNTSHSKLFKILNPSKQNVSIQTEKISAQV